MLFKKELKQVFQKRENKFIFKIHAEKRNLKYIKNRYIILVIKL